MVRSPVIGGEHGRETVDDRGESIRMSHRHDGDDRFAGFSHGLDELHLLRRQVDIRGVAALSLGDVRDRTTPSGHRRRG